MVIGMVVCIVTVKVMPRVMVAPLAYGRRLFAMLIMRLMGVLMSVRWGTLVQLLKRGRRHHEPLAP